jgi:hypothetical protein
MSLGRLSPYRNSVCIYLITCPPHLILLYLINLTIVKFPIIRFPPATGDFLPFIDIISSSPFIINAGL